MLKACPYSVLDKQHVPDPHIEKIIRETCDEIRAIFKNAARAGVITKEAKGHAT